MPNKASFSFHEDFGHGDELGLNKTTMMELLDKWGNKNKRRMRMYHNFGYFVFNK